MNNQLAAEGVSDNSHSAQLSDGKFHNTAEVERPSFKKTLGIFKRFITEKKIDAEISESVKNAIEAPEPPSEELTKYIWADD